MNESDKEAIRNAIKKIKTEAKRDGKKCFGKYYDPNSKCMLCPVMTKALCEVEFMKNHPEKFH